MNSLNDAMSMGVFLERIWPPGDAPEGWISQIGGHPNLPVDWEWPRIEFEHEGKEQSASLDFLAQIRLSDLPDVPDRDLLPKSGVLFFFALALSAEPIDDYGPDAWRVLYYPGDVSGFPRRPPPQDAGWFLDDTDYGRMPAAEFLDPDAGAAFLFPRCPVRPIVAATWKRDGRTGSDAWRAWKERVDAWPSAPALETTFRHNEKRMPYRVEDAILHLNYARNLWREGALSFEEFCRRKYELAKLDEAGKEKLRGEYEDWLTRTKLAANQLHTRNRATPLSESERAHVLELTAENAERLRQLGCSVYFRPQTAAEASLATLLDDAPEIAASMSDEVAAAHPAHDHFKGLSWHRMLGHSYVVQSDLADDRVLLLQLGSDENGPRLMWWDVGNLTFSISRADLAARRFDLAAADIEGG